MIPYPLDLVDNKVFKEQLGYLTSVQLCRNISFRTNEEMFDESEDQTLTLKTTFEDSASDGDPYSKEVNSEESQPMVT